MFFLDDMVLRTLGISIPGLDMFWVLEQVYKFAYRELYNPDKIRGQIKENRLLYEFGEISREVYERTHADLMRDLRLALKADEMDIGSRNDILG